MRKVGNELVQLAFDKYNQLRNGIGGALFEQVLQLQFWLLNGKSMGSMNCFKKIKELENITLNANSLAFVSNFDQLPNLKVGSLCFVSNKMGPDHIWIISKDPLIVMLVQDKQFVESTVSTEETHQGVLTTIINSNYGNFLKSSGVNDNNNNDDNENNQKPVVIRVHVFVPKVPDSINHDFESGKTRVSSNSVNGNKKNKKNH